jgi:1,2-diacylglycerol-3-alpha-glucose alpha-1,2-glucosyltransferase
MKICLYLEFKHFQQGKFYSKIGTGLLSSYNNQKTRLSDMNIAYTEKWENSYDILQINSPWFKSLFLIWRAKRSNKKVILWAHTTAEDSKELFRFTPLFSPLYRRYLTYAYSQADLIFAPTEYTKKLLIDYGLAPDKISVQSNAIDLKKYYQDETKRISGQKKYNLRTLTIGCVGLIIPRKGTDTFLTLVNQFSKNQFIWFGKFYSNLLVKPLPRPLPKNVKFTGYIDDINEAYNTMDIFLFPSYEENEGMAVLEACAVGLPILVRDIPAYKDWLIHGKNCLKAKDDQEFEKYLTQLISDADLRQRLGQEAKKTAQAKSLEALSQSLLTEYNKLLIS